MIDLVMFAFLVTCDLAVGAVAEVGEYGCDLCALLVINSMAEIESVNVYPLIQAAVICF